MPTKSNNPINGLIRFCLENKLVVILFTVVLIVWGIVGWEYGPKGWIYALNDGDALDQLESSGVDAFRWKDHR